LEKSTYIVPEVFDGPDVEIYECEKAVSLERHIAIQPALVMYKNHRVQYAVTVFAPKYSYMQLAIKRIARLFDSLKHSHPRIGSETGH